MRALIFIFLMAGLQLTAQTSPKKATTTNKANSQQQQNTSGQQTDQTRKKADSTQFPEGYYKQPKDASGKDSNKIGGTPK
jgi:hypothetical protein